jgi:RNase P/RNase MRP subunit POP5
MKALIPSHREKRRYLFLEGKNLKKNVPSAIKEFVGILGLSEAAPVWIKENIISVNRKSLDKVKASFALFKDKINVKKVSGTLKGLGF